MRDRKLSVLVLCTGNSCRSQMAEAYLRHLGGQRLEVASAGTEPAAAVHPLTLRVMAEDGLDLGSHRPKTYRQFLVDRQIDYLIVVCDGAARACPTAWPGVGTRLAWPFDDPAILEGSESEVLAGFRRVRDEIKGRVRRWIARLDDPQLAAAAGDPR